MDAASGGDGASLERVLQVTPLAELVVAMLARVSDDDGCDLGRAACVCTALRDACAAVDGAWERACVARFPGAAEARASLADTTAGAQQPFWRCHFYERASRGQWRTARDGGAVITPQADCALFLLDVWHGSTLVFSAAMFPWNAGYVPKEMCYSSDSDDHQFDTEWRPEFVVHNGLDPKTVFVDASRLQACAWLLRRDGAMVRAMCGARAELNFHIEGSIVTWRGTRRFTFRDGAKPGPRPLLLTAFGLLVDDWRWSQRGLQPPPRDSHRLDTLHVRWEPADDG